MARQVSVNADSSEGPVDPALEALPLQLRKCNVILNNGDVVFVEGWDTFSTKDFNGFTQYWFECQGKTVAVFPVHMLMALTEFKDM